MIKNIKGDEGDIEKMKSKENRLRAEEKFEGELKFRETLDVMENDPKVLELKNYTHHRVTSRFGHCHNVAVYSFYLARKLHWKVNMRSLAVGAMLHDYFLYDTKNRGMASYSHVSKHPKTALRNAERDFSLNGTEKNIILSHMWPIPMSVRPRCKEAVLVCLADKYCAYQEGVNGIGNIENILRRRGRAINCLPVGMLAEGSTGTSSN